MMKIDDFLIYLDKLFPNAHCELNYRCDYELLIAVMLSAQSSDKSVNNVTKILFQKYDSLSSLSNANLDDVVNIIKPLGMSKIKGKRIVDIAQKLVNDFNGKVPSDRELLMSFPGVGNKTANVVRAEYFRIPEIPVDTHVSRVCKRLGFASNKDEPIDIEQKLKRLIDKNRQIKAHHQIIFFGRYFCKAINPSCNFCEMQKQCKYFKNK